jgi:prevent-host-death family protein
MHIIHATDAKNNFGYMLDTAQREPITIEKKGRPVAVVLSVDDYTRLEAFEEEIWVLKAKLSEKEGYIGTKQSKNLIDGILNAGD